MMGNVTLKDIQNVVFENIDLMLEELDMADSTKALASSANNLEIQDMTLNTGAIRGSFRGRSRFGRSSRPTRGRYLAQSQTNSSFGTPSMKFCRLCHLAGSEQRIVTSHEIRECSRLSLKDMDSLKNSFALNYAVLQDYADEPEDPSNGLEP